MRVEIQTASEMSMLTTIWTLWLKERLQVCIRSSADELIGAAQAILGEIAANIRTAVFGE
jgi:hypothetical protein